VRLKQDLRIPRHFDLESQVCMVGCLNDMEAWKIVSAE
jgi:DNA-binding transcriptional regulator/RsmH inhibitor MraZ